MGRTRVLVVDDSALVRTMVANWIADEADLAVAGTAANGRQGLEKFESLRPDAVLLDVEMPVMDGLETLRAIRSRDPGVPVIMFSTLTSRGGSTTLDALAMGATDYLLKPSTTGEVRVGGEETRRQLLEKLRGLRRGSPATRAPTPRGRAFEPPAARVEVVAIGASTGGPNALETIFRALPADLPVPILVVQHMPPFFTSFLAERLGRVSRLRVAEAASGMEPRPGEAWIAPGGFHMTIERTGAGPVLEVSDHEPPENGCRPSVDVLFRSVATVYGEHALAAILTGMGQDGLEGARAVRAKDGRVLAQDEASSVVWSMPGHVAREGLASAILDPAELAVEIERRTTALRVPLREGRA